MTWEGVGFAVRIDDRMDGNLYLQILNYKLQETLEYYGFNPPDIIFQQDLESKHTRKMVKEWLEVHEFKARPQPYQTSLGLAQEQACRV